MSDKYPGEYDDSLLHVRWLNGLDYISHKNLDEDSALSDGTSRLLAVIADTAMRQSLDMFMAIVAGMGFALRLGYYLGKNGVDADAPVPDQGFLRGAVEPLITPGCTCSPCRAKTDYLKEHGIDYEITPERQDLADALEQDMQVDKMIEDALPSEDFNPCEN